MLDEEGVFKTSHFFARKENELIKKYIGDADFIRYFRDYFHCNHFPDKKVYIFYGVIILEIYDPVLEGTEFVMKYRLITPIEEVLKSNEPDTYFKRTSGLRQRHHS
tara:strand:- start:51337 stop:51654 length:318 start_codon:yes stop_codon:yes gene_type:complete